MISGCRLSTCTPADDQLRQPKLGCLHSISPSLHTWSRSWKSRLRFCCAPSDTVVVEKVNLQSQVPVFSGASAACRVTSMSADTHKFGQAHKGTSVVLYRGPEYRRFQYTSITEWSGGLYISPGAH